MHEKLRTMSMKGKSWWNNRSRVQKIGLVITAVILVLIILKNNDPLANASIETVKKQNLDRTVQASGSVVSTTDLALSFQEGDVVNSIRVTVGQKVKKGQILATLTSGEESAAVTQARGGVLKAQAAYNKVLEGSSNEEIKLAQVKLDTTTKLQNNLVENARRKLYSDDLIAQPQDSNAEDSIPEISGSYDGIAGEYRIEADLLSGGKQLEVRGLENTTAAISDLRPQPLGTRGLSILFTERDTVSQGSSWKIEVPNTASSSYTTNLNAYESALETRDAEIAQAQAELDLKKATARQPDVDAALADVITAQAEMEAATARYEKKILRAPADGTITKIDIMLGDLVQAQDPAMTLQDVDNLYVEALVNESDISMVSLGQPVVITYDAFGPDVSYRATISSVDLGSTLTDGIVNYKIKALIDDTTNIKPGMTANLTVTTASISNVLVVPARMIMTADGQKTVAVLVDERKGKMTPTPITTGLSGDGDLVEVTSGLTEGQKVVLFPEK